MILKNVLVFGVLKPSASAQRLAGGLLLDSIRARHGSVGQRQAAETICPDTVDLCYRGLDRVEDRDTSGKRSGAKT